MDLNLINKVAIVTGSSRGIGKGIALALAAEGCQITLCARNERDLQTCATEIKKLNVDVLTLAVDVTKSDEMTDMVKTTINRFGKINILVNNVGGNRRKRFEDTVDADWKEIIDINLMAHIQLTRVVIPTMKKQKSGSIIFISSIFGRESGGKNLSIYNTTKSALISLSKVLATELISD